MFYEHSINLNVGISRFNNDWKINIFIFSDHLQIKVWPPKKKCTPFFQKQHQTTLSNLSMSKMTMFFFWRCSYTQWWIEVYLLTCILNPNIIFYETQSKIDQSFIHCDDFGWWCLLTLILFFHSKIFEP